MSLVPWTSGATSIRIQASTKTVSGSTHRQRTQNYIKTLESEVVRLRGSENTLIQERDNLQGKLEILRTTCQVRMFLILGPIVLSLQLQDNP